jgi:predicted RNA-binding Zn ribbon-like protein
VTGQADLDSYRDAGVLVSVDLVNELVVAQAEAAQPDRALLATLKRIFAIDPPSVAGVKAAHLPELVQLAQRLHAVFAGLAAGDVDAAARGLNELLARHPAQPHLAKEDGVWRLHHHPAEAPLVPMWTAICAEGLARVVGLPSAQRLGTCERPGCGRVFVDVSKNASRRFCSQACQNRVKAASFRARRAAKSA